MPLYFNYMYLFKIKCQDGNIQDDFVLDIVNEAVDLATNGLNIEYNM